MPQLRQEVLKISLFLLISGLASTIVFWLLRIPSGYILGILQFVIIIMFAITLLGISAKLKIHIKMPQRTISIVTIVISALLLMSVILHWYSTITVGLSLLIISILPGYVILHLARIEPAETTIETLVLSYALSIPITAVVGSIVFSYVNVGFREIALALTYFFMSFLLFISRPYNTKANGNSTIKILEVTNTLFLLILGIIFFVYIANFYPLMAYVPNSDIARHFGSVQQIIRAPNLFSSIYPWFTCYEAVFSALGKPSLGNFQTGLALSSFIMILAFYVMASIYLKSFDKRLPIIATVFWSIFSGFGWLHFIHERLTTDKPFFDLLRLTNDVSYIDISIPRVWFWFRPMIPGFITLFIMLYLLKRRDISTTSFRLIYSILIISLVFFHVPELVVLVIVISVLSIFVPHIGLRLKDAIISGFIGISVTYMLVFSLYTGNGLMSSIPGYVLLMLTLPLMISYLALKFNWKGIDIFNESTRFIIYVIIITYIVGIISWFANPSFSMWMVRDTLFVPWLLYPVRLGLVGLLGLLGVLALRKHNNDCVILFIYMFFSTLIFARLLSYVNIHLFTTRFYEQRFIQASLLPSASILAAYAMKSLLNRVTSFRNLKVRKVFLITLASSLIVIVGTGSTFLAYDYLIEASRRGAIGDDELNSVFFLSNDLYDNPRSPVLTFTTKSMTEVGYSGPILVVNQLHLPAWASTCPEIPLLVFFRGDQQFTAPYIYVHERDKDAIIKRFPTGNLFKEITPILPLLYQNEKVELYKIPEGSPPSMNSSTALLVPFDYQWSENTVLVLLSLSLGGYEYTTMLDSDTSVLKKDVIIIPTDTTPAVIDQLLRDGSTKKLIVFNSMGYGSIGRAFFSGETEQVREVKVNLIEGTEKLSLPFDVSLAPIKAKEDVEILGWFSGGGEKIPFVGRKIMNGTEITYINIYPLITHIVHSKSPASALLGNILNAVELDLKKFSVADFKLQDLLFFEDGTFEGAVNIMTSSIIFSSTENVQLRLEGEQKVYDISSISLTGVNSVRIRTNYGKIGKGIGFYAKLMIGNSTFELKGEEIGLEAELDNGEMIQLNGLSTLKFHTGERVLIYARTPTLSITGNTTFQQAYGLHKIYRQFQISGHTLRSNGQFNFSILASDVYTIAKDLSWQGSVQRTTPIIQWNELGSLKDSVPWFALVTVLFVSYRYFVSWKKGVRIMISNKKRCS